MRALSWSDRAMVGFISGLVLGVGLSTAAALYITNSPVPFVNKVQRPTEKVNPGAGGELPEPKRPLSSNPAVLPAPPPERPREWTPVPTDDKSRAGPGAALPSNADDSAGPIGYRPN